MPPTNDPYRAEWARMNRSAGARSPDFAVALIVSFLGFGVAGFAALWGTFQLSGPARVVLQAVGAVMALAITAFGVRAQQRGRPERASGVVLGLVGSLAFAFAVFAWALLTSGPLR